MKNLSKKLIIISSFIFGALHLSAQTITYDSIADDDSRQDTLTFVEDFADAKYALNALFVSDDSLTFKLNKINANGAISATVADDTLTISALANGYGQASVEVLVDVAVCFEERVYELVEEDLQIRESVDFKPLHIVNIETKDNPKAAAKSAELALELCQMIEGLEDLEDSLDDIVDEFQEKYDLQINHNMHLI